MGVVLLALFLVLRILKERTWKEMESKKEKRKGKGTCTVRCMTKNIEGVQEEDYGAFPETVGYWTD